MGRIWISSSTFGKAFLAKAWEARNELQDYERRGFAQFFYQTICGHTEALLAEVIKLRMRSISHIRWDAIPPYQFSFNGVKQSCALTPVTDSIKQIASKLLSDTETATLAKLIEIYNLIFSCKLSDLMGSEEYQDLTALIALRNLFAHGRDIAVEFTNDESGNLFSGSLDGNPLQHPAQRLYRAGIIKSLEFNGNNHWDFLSQFFSDQALMHFYASVKLLEDKIRLTATFPPETNIRFNTPLPDLAI